MKNASQLSYWMFRVSNKWGKMTSLCFDENLVCCGWNCGLSNKSRSEILKANPDASKMAIRFLDIKKGDYIIMPVHQAIAIGIAGDKVHRPDLKWQDTIKVEWLTKSYPRKDLSSAFQGSLKYRGTFLSLNKYRNELDAIVKNDYSRIGDLYSTKREEFLGNSIQALSKHLNNRKNLKFQDREFERFVLNLLELEYEGLTGGINNQIQENIDGKDLTLSIDYDDFGINIRFNVQVKQHDGNASLKGLKQIDKSDASDPFVKNVLVTTGRFTDALREEAESRNIIVFGPDEIAGFILNNFDSIEDKWLPKLGLIRDIRPVW